MLLAVELVSKKSLSLATIKKLVSLHCLLTAMHHIMENGKDMRYIQELLSHKSSKTT